MCILFLTFRTKVRNLGKLEKKLREVIAPSNFP